MSSQIPRSRLQLARELTPLPAETLGKAGLAPHLGSTVELTLLTAQVSQASAREHGDLAPPLICRKAACMGGEIRTETHQC